MQIIEIIISFIVILFLLVFTALIEVEVKYEYRVTLAILGMVMICSLPLVWAISFNPTKSHISLFSHGFFIVMIGGLIVSLCYSWFLAEGLVFLSIGTIETIEQLWLSQFYPSFSFCMLKWNTWLAMGILFMLLAIPERLFRAKVGKSV